MKRENLAERIDLWQNNLERLHENRATIKRLTEEKFALESDDGLFWSELKDLAHEIALEHAKALCEERNWECAPQDVFINAVTDVTEKSILIIYALHVAHRVAIRYFFVTNATILENFEEDAV